jgi:recombination associated protein RdgC
MVSDAHGILASADVSISLTPRRFLLPPLPTSRTRPRTLSALRGSLTFTRFYVTGDIPDDIPGTTLRRIRANSFQPLSPEDDKSEGSGWANVEDPVDIDLDHEKVFFNEYLCLSLRVDRWAIPSPLLKAHLRDAEQALLEKRGLERLGRQAKADLKTMVIRKLRRQLVPSLKSYDVVWNLNSHVLHFHSQSERITSLFEDLFKKTFKLDLVPESPGTAAHRMGLDARQAAALAGLEPMSLARLEEA